MFGWIECKNITEQALCNCEDYLRFFFYIMGLSFPLTVSHKKMWLLSVQILFAWQWHFKKKKFKRNKNKLKWFSALKYDLQTYLGFKHKHKRSRNNRSTEKFIFLFLCLLFFHHKQILWTTNSLLLGKCLYFTWLVYYSMIIPGVCPSMWHILRTLLWFIH